MSNRKLVTVGALAIGVISVVALQARLKGARAPVLTALDYAEIQQLNAHYAHALDTCAGKGSEFADLFAPDGVYIYGNGRKVQGRETLAAIGGGPDCAPPRDSPLHIRHIFANTTIRPSPDGAVGSSDFWVLSIDENGKIEQLLGGAEADDVYTKTPAGWRLKSRGISQIFGHL